jgi:hypothetical protein
VIGATINGLAHPREAVCFLRNIFQ